MKANNVKTEELKEEKPKMVVEEVEFEDFGFEDNSSGKNIYDELYFVKMKTKTNAFFEFSRKMDGKILKDPRQTLKLLEGKLTRIELGSYTYENKENKTFKLYISKVIKDKNVLFILSSTYTQVGRNILNTLLGAKKPIKEIQIKLYNNASGYSSVAILIDGQRGEWMFDIDTQRKHIETIKNKKGEFISNDYSSLDDLFEEKMRDHLSILFPEMDAVRFVEESADEVLKEDEEQTEDNFFEINK